MARGTTMQIRLSDQEKAEIERRAAKRGKKPATFLRDLALQGFSPGEEAPERKIGLLTEHQADAIVGGTHPPAYAPGVPPYDPENE